MADVFVSYSREDRARADQVAQALQAMGIDVFWDSEIPPGTTWADYIEARLSECKAVVVLWSEHSTKSQWVREEARMGRDKGKLIPAMIDNAQSPFGFGEVQAANLADWNGQPDHAEWTRFAEAVRSAANRPAPASSSTPYQPMASFPAKFDPPPASAAQPAATPSHSGGFNLSSVKPMWWLGGLVAVALIVVIGIVSSAGHGGGGPAPLQSTTPQPVASSGATGGPAPLPPSGAGGAPQVDYGQQISAQLTQMQQTLAQQGFQMVGEATNGSLQQGQTATVPASLNVGFEYRIVGVCDQDCSDLDLTLVDQNNNTVSQDTSTDDHPTVNVSPSWTGPFTVQVLMYQCSVQPCYYGLALFGRQAAH